MASEAGAPLARERRWIASAQRAAQALEAIAAMLEVAPLALDRAEWSALVLAVRSEATRLGDEQDLGLERDAADAVVDLALEVARHALRATLAVRPETIVPIVQEALAGVFDESVRMHLHLNPSDEALVREELGARLAQSNCEIVADASIRPGGCRIETPRAEVDATLETRWRRTLAALGRCGEDGP